MDLFHMFCRGAQSLGSHLHEYGPRQQEAGFAAADWQLLTQEEYWSPDQARQVPTLLANACSISLSVAGIPAVPLPGHYVAAVVCQLVAPPNRIVAAIRAPRSFDAVKASGVSGVVENVETSVSQMLALVTLYTEARTYVPQELPPHVQAFIRSEMAKQAETKEAQS